MVPEEVQALLNTREDDEEDVCPQADVERGFELELVVEGGTQAGEYTAAGGESPI